MKVEGATITSAKIPHNLIISNDLSTAPVDRHKTLVFFSNDEE